MRELALGTYPFVVLGIIVFFCAFRGHDPEGLA